MRRWLRRMGRGVRGRRGMFSIALASALLQGCGRSDGGAGFASAETGDSAALHFRKRIVTKFRALHAET